MCYHSLLSCFFVNKYIIQKGPKRSSVRQNSISETDSTASASTLSLTSSLAVSDRKSSPDITTKMADALEPIVKSEKYKPSDLQSACGSSVSPLLNNISHEEPNTMNRSVSSDEINSCTSSDNCYDATATLATSCSKKVRRVVRRVSPRCKQIDRQDNRTLHYVGQGHFQEGKY